MTLYFKQADPPAGVDLNHSVYCGVCGRYFQIDGENEVPDTCPWGCDQ